MSCDCNIIATGSKGNAVQLDHRILLDCGVPFKMLQPILMELNLVLLTHCHGDHFNCATIRRLAQERPLLRFGCRAWMVMPLLDCGVNINRIDAFSPGAKMIYHIFGANYTVENFDLFHDAPNCGYKIQLPNGERVLYATDTGTMDGVLAPDYDLYLIEANYGEAELKERIARKLAANELAYEARVEATHLSKEQADAFLLANAGPKSRFAYLHGHQERSRTTEEQE